MSAALMLPTFLNTSGKSRSPAPNAALDIMKMALYSGIVPGGKLCSVDVDGVFFREVCGVLSSFLLVSLSVFGMLVLGVVGEVEIVLKIMGGVSSSL